MIDPVAGGGSGYLRAPSAAEAEAAEAARGVCPSAALLGPLNPGGGCGVTQRPRGHVWRRPGVCDPAVKGTNPPQQLGLS